MPSQADIKKFEKQFDAYMKRLESRRKLDNRVFAGRDNAGAFLTPDILNNLGKLGLSGRKKLAMAYGNSGSVEYTLAELEQMAKATEKAEERFKPESAGIPVSLAVEAGDKGDKKRAATIKSATLYRMVGNLLDFRVTASGETPGAPPYYKVRVRLEDFKTELRRAKNGDYITSAKRAASGSVSFDCNCGRYIYWYHYLATIGNFDVAPPGENVFPKIRNRGLKGICCKHILKTLFTLQGTFVQKRIADAMSALAKSKDFDTDIESRLNKQDLTDAEWWSQQDTKSKIESEKDFANFLKGIRAFRDKQDEGASRIDNRAKGKEKGAKDAEIKADVKRLHLAMLRTLKDGNMLNDAILGSYAANAKVDKDVLVQIAKEEGLL